MTDVNYKWDPYSDQPATIRDKSSRYQLYIKGLPGSLKTFLLSFAIILFIPRFFRKRHLLGAEPTRIGLGVNIDQPLPEKMPVTHQHLNELVDDLGVNHLLIRLPLSDIEQLQKYVDFIGTFEGKTILVTILQDRRHVVDKSLLYNSLKKIFTALQGQVTDYQIGNAINRRKWAFVTQEEYFDFFSVAYRLKQESFAELNLLGASIIDFELPDFLRAICHFRKFQYDGIASLLYVDRRGSPENRQFGFDLLGKIKALSALSEGFSKIPKDLWITETNWPLEGTIPFSPSHDDCMVSEEKQAKYLARYYLLALASGRVKACFWHQLIAPGYGLVDNLGDKLRKRPAYFSFKVVSQLFSGATIRAFEEHQNSYFRLAASHENGVVEAFWTNDIEYDLAVPEGKTIINLLGETVQPDSRNQIRLTGEVVYVLDNQLARQYIAS